MEILENLNNPKVVATVHQPEDLDFLGENDLTEVCDLLEFRLDSLRNHLVRTEETIAATTVPCIITARHPEEGGDGNLDSAARRSLYERFLPHAALIDIEDRSLHEMAPIVTAAREAKVAVIASFHDFEGTPSISELDVITRPASGAADIAKVAVRLETLMALFELVILLEPNSPLRPISLMGMGPFGKLSRLVLATAGSCLNYGYLREANAPGQWPAAELKRLIAELRADQT